MVLEPKFTDEGKDVEPVRGMFHHERVGFRRSKIRPWVRALQIRAGVSHIPDIEDSAQGIDVFMPSGMVPLQFRSAVRALPQFTMEIHSLFRGNPVFS
ncbi:hypothetical protein D3C79_805260 [compost metagenome]